MAHYLDVARLFVQLAGGGEEGDPLTPLRLHKLMYYAQGWALAAFGEPLFDARIEAWTHGPVVREMYKAFAGSGAPIKADDFGTPGLLSTRVRSFVVAVWGEYGQFSAGKLCDMTHAEAPWINARRGIPAEQRSSREITPESMRDFFTGLLAKVAIPGVAPADAYQALVELERGEGKPAREVFARLRGERCATN